MKLRDLNSILVATTLALAFLFSTTDAQSSPDYGVEAFDGPRYERATVAIKLMDPENGKVLYERNPAAAVMPASCLKILVTAAAMHKFGPDHRLETALGVAGTTNSAGVLKGSVVIRGGGDPTLGSTRVASSVDSATLVKKWCDEIKAAGVKEIDGGVVADTSYFGVDEVPGGFMWDDLSNYYGAGTSGLCFNDNLYWLYFKPGPRVGDPTEVLGTEPPLPGIDWLNQVLTGPPDSGDNAYIFGAPGEKLRILKGTVEAGGPFGIKGALPSPGLVVATKLTESLNQAGIMVKEDPRVSYEKGAFEGPRFTTVTVHQSPTMNEIINRLNKQSFNLYAETLLMHLGKATEGPTLDEGIEAERDYFKSIGADVEGLRPVDGSGLSRANTVTANSMVSLLAALRTQPHFEKWLDTLPVIGTDADLRRRESASGIKGRVKAKTGFIGGVRGLCGYLDAKSGKRLVFAVIINHFNGRMSEVDKDTDTFLRKAYEAH